MATPNSQPRLLPMCSERAPKVKSVPTNTSLRLRCRPWPASPTERLLQECILPFTCSNSAFHVFCRKLPLCDRHRSSKTANSIDALSLRSKALGRPLASTSQSSSTQSSSNKLFGSSPTNSQPPRNPRSTLLPMMLVNLNGHTVAEPKALGCPRTQPLKLQRPSSLSANPAHAD